MQISHWKVEGVNGEGRNFQRIQHTQFVHPRMLLLWKGNICAPAAIRSSLRTKTSTNSPHFGRQGWVGPKFDSSLGKLFAWVVGEVEHFGRQNFGSILWGIHQICARIHSPQRRGTEKVARFWRADAKDQTIGSAAQCRSQYVQASQAHLNWQVDQLATEHE